MFTWKYISGCIPCNFICSCCDKLYSRCQRGEPGFIKQFLNNDEYRCEYMCEYCWIHCKKPEECTIKTKSI